MMLLELKKQDLRQKLKEFNVQSKNISSDSSNIIFKNYL